MLRTVIASVAIAAVAFTLVLTIQEPAAWPMLAMTLLFAIGCVWERRYHAAQQGNPPSDRFRATGERFVDPESGRVTAAWVDPKTGERRYVDDGEPPAPPA